MVDFRKKLSKGEIEKKINPLEIYNTLDRRSVTGPLRPAQSKILSEWFENKQKEKDLIIKLHTGEGKTLIGLLILQSKINQNLGPCAFICPNIYLSAQVANEATKFGIPFCQFQEDNELPNDFITGNKILITHVQKLFNGKSKFGIDTKSTHIGCIILDDSHSCIDSIKSSFTIRIKREHPLFEDILNLFEEDLKEQGEGSFLDIKNGDYESLLQIPYWSWHDKRIDITRLLSSYKEENMLKFTWPILKNNIEKCQAFVTGNGIEIVPYYIPIQIFGSFANAGQRILMSATTQDDSFFIKGLGFNAEAVINPLINPEQKWSGEKMLLIPSHIHEYLNRDIIINTFAKPRNDLNFGIVALVPSRRRSANYDDLGSNIATPSNIFDSILHLKSGKFEKPLVIVNRYDGIDLPDEACRILIIDSMPYFDSLVDRYEEQCRINSDIINIRLAQKVEQGLGRSVRGEKDYSVILVIGADLVKFIKSISTNKYFSQQTQKNIEIGFEIAKMAQEDIITDKNAKKTLNSLINQALLRDEAWKEFYKEEMDKIADNQRESNIYKILQLEKEAEEANYRGDNENACAKIQSLIDNHISNDSEKGWYLQILARYKYLLSKTDSNQLQKSAFNYNFQLLKPKDGITYKKIGYINENRINRIKEWMSKYDTYRELTLAVDDILNDFSFGINSEKFENAVKEIGELLGFISQRPDKEIRKGPDNLWCGVDNKYFLIECKSEVSDTRESVNKNEAGQMDSHCGWFESEYGAEVKVTRILIIPTIKLSYHADFTHDVKIMRKGKLRDLKENIKSFIKEFKPYKIDQISDETINNFINTHKLDISSLSTLYVENYKKSNT